MIIIDEATVFTMARQLTNPRLTAEEYEEKINLPRMQYVADFEDRAINGGPLSFLEARCVVREFLTHDKWVISFYEVIQFPQARYFVNGDEAWAYFDSVTIKGTDLESRKISPRRLVLYGPKNKIYGQRKSVKTWELPNYKPDPIIKGLT